MHADSLDRPDRACLLCPPPRKIGHWRPADPGYKTCGDCLDRIRRALTDVRDQWATLNPTPTRAADPDSRGAPGFGSRSPASDHIITMRDPRSKSCETGVDATVYEHWTRDVHNGWKPEPLPPGFIGPPPLGGYATKRDAWFGGDGRPHSEQERPPLSIPATIAGLCFLVAEDRDMQPPTGPVDHLCRWLDAQLDHVTRQEWVVDVHEPIRELQGQLRAVHDRRRLIGACSVLVGDDGDLHECGGKLYAPTELSWDVTIRCRSCGAEWARDEWLRLADILEAS